MLFCTDDGVMGKPPLKLNAGAAATRYNVDIAGADDQFVIKIPPEDGG